MASVDYAERAVGEVLASEASGVGVSPSEARLPPVGLASSRRRRRIASLSIFCCSPFHQLCCVYLFSFISYETEMYNF